MEKSVFVCIGLKAVQGCKYYSLSADKCHSSFYRGKQQRAGKTGPLLLRQIQLSRIIVQRLFANLQ